VHQSKPQSDWATIILILILAAVIIGGTALGWYSLLNSREAKQGVGRIATSISQVILDFGQGLFWLFVALAIGVVILAIGRAVMEGGPSVGRTISNIKFINALEKRGGSLRLPSGETLEIEKPSSAGALEVPEASKERSKE